KGHGLLSSKNSLSSPGCLLGAQTIGDSPEFKEPFVSRSFMVFDKLSHNFPRIRIEPNRKRTLRKLSETYCEASDVSKIASPPHTLLRELLPNKYSSVAKVKELGFSRPA